jgi:hypothetical protein
VQLEVLFSQHAQRRARLYKIPKKEILKILGKAEFQQGENEIIANISGFELPIKIVFSVENDALTVITNYPLKKGLKK